MNDSECMQWLRNENLLSAAERHYNDFRKVFSECLRVKSRENVLILGDTGIGSNRLSAIISACYYIFCMKNGITSRLVMQPSKRRGEKAEGFINDALRTLRKGSIIITALSDHLGSLEGTFSFRDFCKGNGHRFVSTTSLGYIPNDCFHDIISAINIDYRELRNRHRKIIQSLGRAREIRVTTKKGTDLTLSIRGNSAISSGGNFSEPGTGGNIPAGEVYIAPVEGTGEGRVVVDASSRSRMSTSVMRNPMVINISKGSISSIEGGKEARLLEESLDWARKKATYPERVSKLCELGIGTNMNAKVIGATIIDEKAMGTAHVAFGSNHWFGGTIKTIVHFDQVFWNPVIYADGKKIIMP